MAKIMKKMAEHERMMEQIEATENGAVMPSTHSMDPDGANSHQDPIVAQEIQKKRQYVEKLKS